MTNIGSAAADRLGFSRLTPQSLAIQNFRMRRQPATVLRPVTRARLALVQPRGPQARPPQGVFTRGAPRAAIPPSSPLASCACARLRPSPGSARPLTSACTPASPAVTPIRDCDADLRSAVTRCRGITAGNSRASEPPLIVALHPRQLASRLSLFFVVWSAGPGRAYKQFAPVWERQIPAVGPIGPVLRPIAIDNNLGSLG